MVHLSMGRGRPRVPTAGRLATGRRHLARLMMLLPYLLTLGVLIAMAIFRGDRSLAPRSLGLVYLRQDRH